jgi:uncharacterized cupredoxin-like copper-binding protein
MLHPLRQRHMRMPMLTASVSFLLIALAACGSDSKSSSTTAAAAAPAATTAPAPAATQAPAATTAAAGTTASAGTTAAASGTSVTVGESEFKIDLGQTAFTAGDYTFNISNSGSFKHNLIFQAADGTKVQSDTLNPGSAGTLSATLAAGSYEVYCGVPTHKGKGMDLTITVT